MDTIYKKTKSGKFNKFKTYYLLISCIDITYQPYITIRMQHGGTHYFCN